MRAVLAGASRQGRTPRLALRPRNASTATDGLERSPTVARQPTQGRAQGRVSIQAKHEIGLALPGLRADALDERSPLR